MHSFMDEGENCSEGEYFASLEFGTFPHDVSLHFPVMTKVARRTFLHVLIQFDDRVNMNAELC